MEKNTEKTGTETTETVKNNAETNPATTVTDNGNSETSKDSNAKVDENEETGSGNNKTASGNSESKVQRVQFSVRTVKENKEFFDEFHRRIKQQNPEATADHALSLLFEMAEQALHIPDLMAKIQALESRQPEIREVPKEVVKEVPVKLLDNQALITFDDKMIEMIRKCRPFLKKKSVLTWENDAEFISKLTTASIRKFLLLHCDNVINPL